MPARTTIISSLEMKRGPGLPQVITHTDIMQLAGRAGRRGFDKSGNCILLNSTKVSLKKIMHQMNQGATPIKSSFRSDYGMVLNLIGGMGEEEANSLLKSSFLNYQSAMGAAEIASKNLQVRNILDRACETP